MAVSDEEEAVGRGEDGLVKRDGIGGTWCKERVNVDGIGG